MAGLKTTFIRATIASGGTPQQLSSAFNAARKVVFKCPFANAGLVKLGLTGFTSAYFTLERGESIELEHLDLSTIYGDGTTDDEVEVIVLHD